MNRKQLLWIVPSIWLLALFVWLLFYFLLPGRGVNLRGFNEIRIGMARETLEEIMGCPAGDYCSLRIDWGLRLGEGRRSWGTERFKSPRDADSYENLQWLTDQVFITVWLDEDGEAVAASFAFSPDPGRNLLLRLLDFFGL